MLGLRGTTIAIAVVSAIGIGCGGSGSSESGSQEGETADPDIPFRSVAGLPDEPFGGDLAIELALHVPELPGDGVVVEVSAGGNGELDQSGYSPVWVVLIFSPSAGEARGVQLYASLGALVLGPIGVPECETRLPERLPASSSVIISDAERRYAPLDPYDGGNTNRSYDAVRGCSAPEILVHVFRWSPEGQGATRFDIDYTWEGEFVDMCGPCPGTAQCCDA